MSEVVLGNEWAVVAGDCLYRKEDLPNEGMARLPKKVFVVSPQMSAECPLVELSTEAPRVGFRRGDSIALSEQQVKQYYQTHQPT